MFADALRTAGDLTRARNFWPYEVNDLIWKLWHGQPPPADELASISRDPVRLWGNNVIIPLLLKSLVNHDRAPEVVDLYRRRFGAPEKLQPYPLGHGDFVQDATTVAIALHDVGRTEEADRMLILVRQSVDERFRRGRVPRQYYYLASLVAAAQQDDRTALGWLAKADPNKLWYEVENSLPDIADEPAFRRLRNNPQFQAIAQRQRDWQARERREMAPMFARLETRQ